MANIINRQQTFSTNGTVTAAGLHNLIDTALVNSAIIKNQQEITTIGTADLLLIAPDSVDSSLAPRKVTVQNLFDDGLTSGTFTSLNLTGDLTYGTATGNRTVSTTATISTATISTGIITSLTAGTTTSTAATITNGTITNGTITTALIPTLTAGTTTGTAGIFTSGTVTTLNSTTGTIGNFTTTLTGDVTISTGSATVGTRIAVLNTAQQYSRAHNFAATALTITSGTVPWNLAENQVATLTVTTNSTMNTPTNPQAGSTYVMIVTQGTGGSNTLSFSTAYKFAGGSAPVLSTGSAQVDVLSFVSNGTVLYGVASQNFS
jgi:hypothetical protein